MLPERSDTMDVLDIVRESSGLIFAKLSHLIMVTVTLVFPVSSITLSQVLSTGIVADRLTRPFHEIAESGRLLENSFNRILYTHLSQTLVSHALCFPVVATLWLLAKTMILYIINCKYQGKEASILEFLDVGPRFWTRLVATYFWICFMVLGFVSFVITSPLLLVGFVAALDLSPNWVGVLEAPLVILFSVAFAHTVVVFNLANVVSVLEERCCAAAVLRAVSLLRGRMQPVLLVFLLSELVTAMLECVFRLRILNNNADTQGSWWWEAPLLIFLHAFAYLFDTTMTFVLYQFCKAEGWEDEREWQHMLEHSSIEAELTDLRCRKMDHSV